MLAKKEEQGLVWYVCDVSSPVHDCTVRQQPPLGPSRDQSFGPGIQTDGDSREAVTFHLTCSVFFASFVMRRANLKKKKEKKANFEIKNKHFLDTSPGYESVPRGTHPDQKGWPQSDNTISRKKGKR